MHELLSCLRKGPKEFHAGPKRLIGGTELCLRVDPAKLDSPQSKFFLPETQHRKRGRRLACNSLDPQTCKVFTRRNPKATEEVCRAVIAVVEDISRRSRSSSSSSAARARSILLMLSARAHGWRQSHGHHHDTSASMILLTSSPFLVCSCTRE